MVEFQLPKLATWVRFPSPAPLLKKNKRLFFCYYDSPGSVYLSDAIDPLGLIACFYLWNLHYIWQRVSPFCLCFLMKIQVQKMDKKVRRKRNGEAKI